MMLLDKIEQIHAADEQAGMAARERWNKVAHPLHSLGNLEDIVVQIARIQGNEFVDISKKALVIMCADNGVVEEGVTQTGQEVTAIVAENFLQEKASAAIMCKCAETDIFPVDIGIVRDTCIINKKIAYGTKNFAKEPAMTMEETLKALETGFEMVKELKEQGYQIIATGEMGIGNTTTSSAIVAALLEKEPEEVTGRGAGLSDRGLLKKIQIIGRAIDRYQLKKEDPLDILAKVGGLDIAGLTGIFLGGAYYHVPILLDGFISSTAALLAQRICPFAKEYMIASHVSKEPAARMLLKELGLSASLECNMRLGEGTGAVAFFPLMDMGVKVYRSMSTFEENSIEQYEEFK
ncbi:MAG: nicotinate-nucleotide--dimethylbenzimidazole phosphoribosyltransferase [Lachnospiraceae bacterium]